MRTTRASPLSCFERPEKRVLSKSFPTLLIISTGSRFSAGFAVVHERILEALGKIPSQRIETYGEDLDIIRFPTERFQRLFGEYLEEKYVDQWPDLVMLLYVGNLGAAENLV